MRILDRPLSSLHAVVFVETKTPPVAGSIARWPSRQPHWRQTSSLLNTAAATAADRDSMPATKNDRGSELLRTGMLGTFAALLLMAGAAPATAQTTVAELSGNNELAPVVAVNPVTNQIFVGLVNLATSPSTEALLVIDGTTDQAVTTIPLPNGGTPTAIAVNPVTNMIYIIYAGPHVSAINGATWAVSDIPYPSGTGPEAVVVNPVTNEIYVANASDSGNGNSVSVIDGATNTVTTTIALPTLAQPSGLGINTVTNTIYTLNVGSTVSVIDGATNTLTTTITMPGFPESIAVNEVTNTIYIDCGLTDYDAGVAVMDGVTNNVTFLPLTGGVDQIVVNPITNMIYTDESSNGVSGTNGSVIVNGATNSVTILLPPNDINLPDVDPSTNEIYGVGGKILNGATNMVTAQVPVDGGNNLAINPVTNKVYVTYYQNFYQDIPSIAVIDEANNQTTPVTAGTAPSAVAVNPATNTAYVTNSGSGNVTAISGTSNATATIAAGDNPAAVAVNPATNTAYVANSGSNTVTVINGADNSTTTLCVGTAPSAVAVNPATNTIYVADSGSNNVSVINGANGASTLIPVGSAPSAIAVNPATDMVYVANSGSNNVTVINGETDATSTVNVGSNPSAIAVDPVTNMIYVANADSGTVSVINGATNATATVMAGTDPVAIAVNPITNMIYVANAGSDNVTVINGATNATSTVNAGTTPSAVAVDATSNKIYVTNSGATTITIIDGPTNTVIPVTAASGAVAVAVNPVTNVMYIANNGGTVTVLTENPIQSIPLTTAIAPIGGTAISSTPTFTFIPTSTFSPNAPGIEGVYYQIDTTQGQWVAATAAVGESYTATPASALSPGTHIVFALAMDGQDATRESSYHHGVGALVTGQIATQVFTVVEPVETSSPAPAIGTLLPPSATAGSGAFTLTLDGSNFAGDSVVSFACLAEPTTFLSAAQLTAAIPASAIANAGTAPVTVTNPAPGGGTISTPVTFTINAAGANNPVPAISMLNPMSTTAGSAGFTLTVTGSNFISSSVVNFNGVAEPTIYVSGSQLTATINASSIATAGMVLVTVTNPAPGGGTSNAATFTISVPAAPQAMLSPGAVMFPATTANTTAPSIPVTLSNPGTAALSISGITITGANPTDFAQTNTCGASVAAGSSCSISLTFTPASAASFTATLSIADNASGSPQTVALSGTGTAPAAPIASLTPATLTFTAVSGATSAAQTATLTNSGNAPLSIAGITITGTNSADFSIANGISACASTLAAGLSCLIYVTFTPASAATFSATLSVADNVSGSPQTASLTGTGTPPVTFILSSPTAPQTIQPGGSAKFTITATAQNGTFSNPVSLSVTGLPTGAIGAFSPASITPGSSSASSTLSIQTGSATTAVNNHGSGWPFATSAIALIGLCMVPGRRCRHWIALALLAIASLGALTVLTACGGGFGLTAPPQSFSITITGTSGTDVETTTVQLTVE